MNVSVNLTKRGTQEQRKISLEGDETFTIADLKEHVRSIVSNGSAVLIDVDATRYYAAQSSLFGIAPWAIQYVITPSGIVWQPPENEVFLADFFNTHGIDDNEIEIIYGGSGRGGGGDLADLWQQFWPFMNNVSSAIGVGTFVSFLVGRIRVRWRNVRMSNRLKELNPAAVSSLALKNPSWSVPEFATLLQTSEQEAQLILSCWAYKYDRETKRYNETQATKAILGQFNSNRALQQHTLSLTANKRLR